MTSHNERYVQDMARLVRSVADNDQASPEARAELIEAMIAKYPPSLIVRELVFLVAEKEEWIRQRFGGLGQAVRQEIYP